MDWSRLSTWCQGILGLSDSELNSLWYERLAEASSSQDSKPHVTVSLYQRAIEEKAPSWLCYRGLGTAYYKQGHIPEAMAQMELALKGAEREDATPKPEAKDMIGLYLLLGQYAYEAGDVHSGDKYYSLACESDDVLQVREGQLGRLKVRLSFPSAEEARQLLKSTLAQENGKMEMAGAMEMIALDPRHDDLVAKMFAVTKGDPDLLKEIVAAMERAIWNLTPGKGRAAGALQGDERFTEDEARGVLLCDRGYAAYMLRVSPDGTEPVNGALRLWKESRDLLANVGGSNALLTRQRATTALASHYFQSIVDGLQLDHYDALVKLTKLANSDPDYNIYHSDSIGFLGAVFVLCGKKESARVVLMKRIRQGLQILSDDILENDKIGFAAIQKTLEHYQDFKNAAVALSLLGQPDLVVDALYFEASDITEVDGEGKQRVLDVVSELAQETIRVSRSQAPDSTLQVQRIEAAIAYVDTLVAAAEVETKAKRNTKPEANGESKDETPRIPDLEAAYAHRLLQSRLSVLQQKHTHNLDSLALAWSWGCDGRMPDGSGCEKWANFEEDFYHCIYCSNKDFCGDCLARLRDTESGVEMMECSAKHKWLQIPRQGDDMYVSLRAKSVRVPIDVRALNGDDKILKAYYAQDGGGEEITVEEWKERLAREWGISLKKILNETSSEDEKS